MFKMLVATDGSTHALKAAEYAATLASRMNDVAVTLLYVGQASEAVFPFLNLGHGTVDYNALEQAMNEQGLAVLDRTAKALDKSSASIESRLVIGDPATTISKLAEEGKFDIVVLGSRGLSDLQGLLIGSVSEQVAHQSKVPVLIVR